MNKKKLSRLLETQSEAVFRLHVVFAAATATVSLAWGWWRSPAPWGCTPISPSATRAAGRTCLQYTTTSPAAVDTASQVHPHQLPLPHHGVRPDTGEVIWSNENFLLQLAGCGSTCSR